MNAIIFILVLSGFGCVINGISMHFPAFGLTGIGLWALAYILAYNF